MLRKFIFFLSFALIFVLGWLSANLYTAVVLGDAERPLALGSLLNGNIERYSPGNHIPEQDIHVYSDKVVIDLEGASWSTFANTNSMDPFIDSDANGIEVKPTSPQDLKLGDVIAFRSPYASGIIIHRIIETGMDNHGWYARTKGDNNPSVDPGKVRFEDVTGVLVGVIY